MRCGTNVMRVAGAVSIVAVALNGPAACASASGVAAAVPWGADSLELRVGGSAQLGSSALTIVFEKVESDSRCPIGVTCVWEGDGVVRLTVGEHGGSRTALTLHTHPNAAQEATHAGFVVRLTALVPHPTRERPSIDVKDYRARLAVTRPAR